MRSSAWICAFFIDAEHQRTIRRVEVEADDVAHLLDEQRIGRQLEGLAAVRLQRERPPDAMHVETDRPECLAIERVLQCVASAGIVSSVVVTTSAIFVVADLARRAAARLVVKAIQALRGEPLAPRRHGAPVERMISARTYPWPRMRRFRALSRPLVAHSAVPFWVDCHHKYIRI